MEPPLPALLSAALVAFTIEADNEAERLVAHRTTSFGGSGERGAVWLTSLAMWFNCLEPLAAAGGRLTAAELAERARMGTNLDGMRRWGYITIDGVGRVPRGEGGRSRPRPRAGSTLALTASGERSAELWRTIPGEIEARWRERFGAQRIDGLRTLLLDRARRDDTPLPDYLPIGALRPVAGMRSSTERAGDAELGLVSLLARALMRFTLDHAAGCPVPLVSWCDLLRVLDETHPRAVRELPARTGVAREPLAVLIGRCERAGLVGRERRAEGRGQALRLTERGGRARAAAGRRIEEVSAAWLAEDPATGELCERLRAIVGDGRREDSPLWAGLQAPEGTWRSRIPAPETLPWYPMVTHRGGYPDGS